MLVLGIETATPQSSVALASHQGLVASATLGAAASGGRGHAEFVVPAVQRCLAAAGCAIGDLTGVAVGLGPGLYTGMRVGIASAQGIAHASRLPVVGVSSLDLLALGGRYVRRTVCAVIDARRGELFWAFYRQSPGGVQRLTEHRVGPPARLAGEIEALREDVLCLGEGAAVARTVLEATGAEVGTPALYPTAVALVELAVPRFLREETQRPEELKPVYLRDVDATISWHGRGALHGGRPGEGGAGSPPPGVEAARWQ